MGNLEPATFAVFYRKGGLAFLFGNLEPFACLCRQSLKGVEGGNPRWRATSANHLLFLVLFLYGLITSCAPGSVSPTDPNRQQPRVAKPVTRPSVKAQKPEWKIGYWWEYSWKRPGRSGIYTEKVIREDTFEDVPSYVTKRGRREYFYTKDVLGEIGRMSRGRVDTKRTPPRQLLSWPLEVGKEWENPYLLERPRGEWSNTVDKRLVVSKVEEVKVPAGTFNAFKIERYDSYSGELTAEYWYSPKVKWFVKRRSYRRNGLREWELISFNID